MDDELKQQEEHSLERFREEGRKRADCLIAAQDEATLQEWREKIERGWQQSESGDVIDGDVARAWFKARSEQQREQSSSVTATPSERRIDENEADPETSE
jgi:hypothetical protein